MSDIVNLYDAKTHPSQRVDRAAKGEEIVIAKNGIPLVRLTPAPRSARHGLMLERVFSREVIGRKLKIADQDVVLSVLESAFWLLSGCMAFSQIVVNLLRDRFAWRHSTCS